MKISFYLIASFSISNRFQFLVSDPDCLLTVFSGTRKWCLIKTNNERSERQIMCHHTGKKKTKHPHCHQNSLVCCGERGLSVLVWRGCRVKLYTQSSIAVLFNIMIHVPPPPSPPLPSAIIQRYLQATFIYTDHRNIIDRSVSEGIMIL